MSTAASRPASAPMGGSGAVSSCSPSLCGIVLDVPDVLYDATLWRRWLFQLLVRIGDSGNYADFERLWNAQLDDVHCGRREYSEALQSFLLARGLSWAQVDEIEAASKIQRPIRELDVRALPGVSRVLSELNHRGIPLLAWADTPHLAAKWAERLERILPNVQFSAVLTSFELEFAQPAKECYRAMSEALGEQPESLLYVGHDALHLDAARQAGFRTAAVNHGADAHAEHLLMRFEELIVWVDSMLKTPPSTTATESISAEASLATKAALPRER